MSVATARRFKLQKCVPQGKGEGQEGAANDFAHRTAGVVIGARVSGPGSTTGTGGESGGGEMGGREGRRNNRRGSRDGNGGCPFLNLIIDPSDKRSQVGALHIVGEDEFGNPWDRTGEVLRGGEVFALSVYDDGVPANVSNDETK